MAKNDAKQANDSKKSGASRTTSELENGATASKKHGLVRTLTIKKRKLEVYFPTVELKKSFQANAEKKGLSSSEYIFHCIRQAEGGVSNSILKKIDELQEMVNTIKSEKEVISTENGQLKEVIRRYEAEVAIIRSREIPLPTRKFEDGITQIDTHLVSILKTYGEVDGFTLLKLLETDPKDWEALKRLNRDLEILRSYGLVEPTQEGWKWVK